MSCVCGSIILTTHDDDEGCDTHFLRHNFKQKDFSPIHIKLDIPQDADFVHAICCPMEQYW